MEITIKIDTRTKEGKSLLEFLKSLSFVQIIDEQSEDKALAEAIREGLNTPNVSKKQILKALAE